MKLCAKPNCSEPVGKGNYLCIQHVDELASHIQKGMDRAGDYIYRERKRNAAAIAKLDGVVIT